MSVATTDGGLTVGNPFHGLAVIEQWNVDVATFGILSTNAIPAVTVAVSDVGDPQFTVGDSTFYPGERVQVKVAWKGPAYDNSLVTFLLCTSTNQTGTPR